MNIQTILDKLTDDLTHYTEVINTIPAYQGIQEFDKVWNGVKDSLTSMLDGIEKDLPEEKENPNYDEAVRTNSLYAFNCYGWNSFREKVINIINSRK